METEDEAPNDIPDFPTILLIVRPEGMEVHIDERINPPMVAGAAWLLEKMAAVGLNRVLQEQNANQPPKLALPNRMTRRMHRA